VRQTEQNFAGSTTLKAESVPPGSQMVALQAGWPCEHSIMCSSLAHVRGQFLNRYSHPSHQELRAPSQATSLWRARACLFLLSLSLARALSLFRSLHRARARALSLSLHTHTHA
jgi:hypothetical protein